MIRKKVADEIFEVRFLPSGKLFGIVQNESLISFKTWSLPNFEVEWIYEIDDELDPAVVEVDISIAPKATKDTIAVSFQIPELSIQFVYRSGDVTFLQPPVVGSHMEAIYRVALSPKGDQLLVQVEDDVENHLWKHGTWELVNEYFEFSRGSWEEHHLVGLGRRKNHLIVWDPTVESLWIEDHSKGSTLAQIHCGDSNIWHRRMSHDFGSALIKDRVLSFVDLDPKGPKERYAEQFVGDKLFSETRYFALHPEKDKVIFSKQTGQIVYVYSRKAKAIVEKFNWARETICGLDYSYDGLLAACGTINGNLIVWDVE